LLPVSESDGGFDSPWFDAQRIMQNRQVFLSPKPLICEGFAGMGF
jgi:hypothetical protein